MLKPCIGSSCFEKEAFIICRFHYDGHFRKRKAMGVVLIMGLWEGLNLQEGEA